jgi:2,4-dienoyl-CoA reductase-like NADH-dependent reductase (Old Yellow Enzyme family)/NADPH-dependent 2,4-dienoyl-CoA reductase/sulfur reductase-like enzyme
MATRFSRLLSPLRIGPMQIRNRMGVTAMGVSLAEEDGSIGERAFAYHRKQAEGGVGIVTLGATGVAYPVGGVQLRQVAISEDRHVPGLAHLADAVHAAGAKLVAQLHHGGLNATIDTLQGRPLWCASVPDYEPGDFMDGFLPEELERALLPRSDVQMKVLDLGDIAQLVQWFAAAARRARAAGIDGLELHAAHGYILSSFLSPATNRRSDAYGGSPENRARLMLEVLRAVREAAGPEIAVWVKLDGAEYGRAGGIGIDDAVAYARMAEAAGADAIVNSAYHDTGRGILHSGSHTPHVPGQNIANAARIKSAVRIPVFCSGRIEPEMAEQAIAGGKFDVLYMGRKLLADPHLPRKLAEGRPQDVIPCVYCYTCISQIYLARPMYCAVNPETAFERELELRPAQVRKRVAVIGGGPAGMEAARRLAARGHSVTLIERSQRLGGTLRFASIAYEPNQRLLDWLERQIAASAVEVRLSTAATPELLRGLAPDAVVVATGAVRSLPPIPGADRSHVLSGDDMRELVQGGKLDALEGKVSRAGRLLVRAGAALGAAAHPALLRGASRLWMPLGERIAIIGGELVGLELAEFLAHRGRKLAVIDDAPRLGSGLALLRRLRLLHELREAGVALFPGASEIAIAEGAVEFRAASGAPARADADHVIVARGARGDTSLAEALERAGFAVHVIGDAGGIGYIDGAMRGAAELAAAL